MDDQTINTYNQLAKEYDEETADFWERFPRTIIDEFAELTKGKILDVGSGSGRDGLILKQRGLEVICIDASDSMVELSSQKGLESIIGDFNSLPFPDETFDGVWSYTALLHVSKAEINKPISEIRRVLKPGGIFGLGMIEGATEEYKESMGVNKPRLFSFYTKQEIEELLQRYGFKVIYFEQFKPGSKNYLNFILEKV